MFEMRDTFDPLTHNIDAKSLNGSTDVDPRLQNAIHGLGVIEIVCENGSGVQRFAPAGPLVHSSHFRNPHHEIYQTAQEQISTKKCSDDLLNI